MNVRGELSAAAFVIEASFLSTKFFNFQSLCTQIFGYPLYALSERIGA